MRNMGSCHLIFPICFPSVVGLNGHILYMVSQYQVVLTSESSKISFVGRLKSEQFHILIIL